MRKSPPRRSFSSPVMLTATMPRRLTRLWNRLTRSAKRVGSSGRSDERHGECCRLAVAQHPNLGLLSNLVGVQVKRELTHVVHRLAADARDNVADLQARLVGGESGLTSSTSTPRFTGRCSPSTRSGVMVRR